MISDKYVVPHLMDYLSKPSLFLFSETKTKNWESHA